MSIELITGKAGEPHVDSEDIGAWNNLIFGGSYILSGCEMTVKNANTIHIAAGEILFAGRYIRIKGDGEDIAIANGTSGYKRNDLICLKYEKFPSNSDIESISIVVIKGEPTTGTPADPTVPAGSPLNGDTVAYMRLCRVVINGLTPATPAVFPGKTTTVSGLNSRLSTAESSITTNKTNITNLTNRMTTAETNIKNVQTSVTQSSATVTMSNVKEGNIIAKKFGKMVCLYSSTNIQLSASLGSWGERQIGTLPAGFRPTEKVFFPMCFDAVVGSLRVDTDGKIYVVSRTNAPSNDRNFVVSAVFLAS